MDNKESSDAESDSSEDLKEYNLLVLNKHFKSKKIHKNSKMTAEMVSQYRDALKNVFFGQFEEASKKLKDLIRVNPDNPDAFHLLGTMHDNVSGQLENAVEYFFMSTYLSPPSVQKWVKVANLSFDLKMYTQAAYCYGRALKIENYNIELMTKRAQAFELSDQTKKAINLYKKILLLTKSLSVIKKYAKIRFKRGQFDKARQILKSSEGCIRDPHVTFMICETFLKEQKYRQMLDFFGEYIVATEEESFSETTYNKGEVLVASQPVGFLKILYIGLKKLQRQTYSGDFTAQIDIQDVTQALLRSYLEEEANIYEDIIRSFEETPSVNKEVLAFLIKLQRHQSVKNYLLYSQVLKAQKRYEECIQVLKHASVQHSQSVEITSQLNHIKVISGYKEPKNQNKSIVKPSTRFQVKSNKEEDIFYSDDDDQQQKLISDSKLNAKRSMNASFEQQKSKVAQMQQQKGTEDISSDPIVVKKLLLNCLQTTRSIVFAIEDESSNASKGAYKQIQECIKFIVNCHKSHRDNRKDEKVSLLNKKHRKRRYYCSKTLNEVEQRNEHLEIIGQILHSTVDYLQHLLKRQCFLKCKFLCQLLSKASFMKWHNRSASMKPLKERIFSIGLLSCLNLRKYDLASYFVKCLARRNPQNNFYLLIVHFLNHNNSRKTSLSMFLGKQFDKGPLQHRQKKEVASGSQSDIFQEVQGEMSEQSHDFSMSKQTSNIGDCMKGSGKLSYLCGLEYMETGCFELAIQAFLKALLLSRQYSEVEKTIWLSLTACFLQLSSSRTTHNKSVETNRSSYCLLRYLSLLREGEFDAEFTFNKARWFAHLKLNLKAVEEFEFLSSPQNKEIVPDNIRTQSALCLMCIHKESENWEKLREVSEVHFNLSDERTIQSHKSAIQSLE